MSDAFVDVLRYPFVNRAWVDGTVTYLVALLVDGTLLRLAAWLWPNLTSLALAFAAVVSLVIFLGLVGGVLADDGFSPLATTETFRLIGRAVGAASVYLFPTAVTVVAVGYVIATGSIPVVLTDVTAAMFATAALLVTIVCAYLFPATTAVSAYEGFHARLRRDALCGVTLGTYLFAWVGAAVLVVLARSVLVAAISRSVAALLALGWCTCAHVAAAALITEGIGRTAPW